MNCVIIDYGLGNLRSIQHKLKRIGVDAVIGRELEILHADLLILPGVGNFSKGMQNLEAYALIPPLRKKVLEDLTPIMGICLGMQLFSKYSEEGNCEGLGWIDAVTKRFQFTASAKAWTEEVSCDEQNNDNQVKRSDKRLLVPHVGWNTIHWRRDSRLQHRIDQDGRFYFTHSYHVVCNDPGDILTTTTYGAEFVSSIHHRNIFGVQFHPEKSHMQGMQIMANFITSMGTR